MFSNSIAELIATIPKNTRIFGLDVGEKTIGIAVSDVDFTIASPVETIERSKFSKDVERMKSLLASRHAGGFVVGYPINMNGTEGPRCQSIRQFCKNLNAALALPILLWDERMSTMAVTRMMDEADFSRNRQAELVDKLAASYILQGALDAYNHKNVKG